MLADYHVHTEFSDDSREPMEEQVKKPSAWGWFAKIYTFEHGEPIAHDF